ncbi:uncharacterized protein M421DRAFT_381593 [Didymella exigua CBS 183.55]|uniref:Uncharacterized protein n=1 Tax=Didymella exigua CBS 183.55 TaxID=1150837 RepID=A0A6A5RRI7_9PLEO|nr:uncharacterized protein M421DRAFT_381593 [Didymella exigua CBS 183.55]KAF1929960.1 hypothetical protein M421DRAFT_381593 [Didymella exigua CBS 183.55]
MHAKIRGPLPAGNSTSPRQYRSHDGNGRTEPRTGLLDRLRSSSLKPCHSYSNPSLLAFGGLAGAAIKGLTLPFGFRFEFPTETLRVSFDLYIAGPGFFGALSTFPRGNVPFPGCQRRRTKDSNSTRSCATIMSIQLAVSLPVEDFMKRSYATVRLEACEPWLSGRNITRTRSLHASGL